MDRPSQALKNSVLRILNNDLSSGIFLILCTLFSLTLANTVLGNNYIGFWNIEIFNHTLGHWINDGLMAIFFCMIGLELKKEIYYGELRNIKTASLPIAAALGGMVVPASIYILLNYNNPEMINGAGIPMATDIAFALAVLTLVGKNVPITLKLFLTALAVIDDLGAIIVIALFYTEELHVVNLGISLGILTLLSFLNWFNYKWLPVYLIGGVFAWYFMLNSGIHATVAGVLFAFTIPSNIDENRSLSHKIEHALLKPVSFLILPLFALSNTAIMINVGSVTAIFETYGLGILLGLCLGKPIGIILFSFIAHQLKICQLPQGVNWKMIFGVGILAGIGFTMSIFIALLAFDPINQHVYINNAKFIILLSSVIAGTIGFIYLKVVCRS